MTYWEAASWIIGIVLFDHYVCGWIRRTLNTALSATVLGGYPETHGWLHIVDVDARAHARAHKAREGFPNSFQNPKIPLPGGLHLHATTSGRNCHRDVNPRFCRSGLTPRADAVVEASDGDGRRRTTKQGRCRALGRALRLGARLSLRRWLGHESNCSFLIRRLRPGLRQNSSSCSRSPIRTYHLFPRPESGRDPCYAGWYRGAL